MVVRRPGRVVGILRRCVIGQRLNCVQLAGSWRSFPTTGEMTTLSELAHKICRGWSPSVFTAGSSLFTAVLLSKLGSADSPAEISTIHTTPSPLTREPKMASHLNQARKEAMWGMFVGDAVSMPVHWYYDPDDIKSGYGGWVTGYRAPNRRHPHSILPLSAIGGSGRSGWGRQSKPLIGSVILHDKLKYWTAGDSSVHYHQGMKPGESTLNAIMALHMIRSMRRVDANCELSDSSVRASVLEDYVKLMTTPGSHNDTYAESFHRAFFQDWSALDSPPHSGEALLEFAEDRYAKKIKGSEDHQLSVIGSLVPAIPWILRGAGKSEDDCVKSTVDFVRLTHPVPSLFPFVEVYTRLLYRVLRGQDLRAEIRTALARKELGGGHKYQTMVALKEEAEGYARDSEKRLRVHQQATSMFGSACYIEGALTSLLYLALNYAEDFEGGVLANANCGGENCHRGAALGALLGAATGAKGQTIPQKWKDGLTSAKEGLQKLSTASPNES